MKENGENESFVDRKLTTEFYFSTRIHGHVA